MRPCACVNAKRCGEEIRHLGEQSCPIGFSLAKKGKKGPSLDLFFKGNLGQFDQFYLVTFFFFQR